LFCLLIGGVSGVLALVVATVVFVWLRQVMLRRLGGTTGDTAGALLELLEMAVLVGLALV
jgi:adenosylcobinamide-GDP ribazoletransferase